jgi:pimeloyl-ACP methyl ester carboxylesterase
MSLKKTIRPLLILFTLLLLGAAFLVENVLPYAGIKPRRHTPQELLWLLPKGVKPENYGLRSRELTIRTADSLQLHAMIVESNTDTTLATVVLVHGISACKEVDMERAKILADLGYASLLLDLRAHGQSEGEYCTFGYYEKNDLRTVADTLYRLFPNRPMGIWGASLGGAVTLQSMAVEPRYQFGIVESTFDEFDKVATEYGADWLFGLRSQWLTNRILSKAGKIAHFDPNAVKPVVSAAQINRPVLFIHGDKDSRIPMWFGQRNYEACPAPGKRWYQVPGAGHNNLWKIAGDSMQQKVFSFLKEQE